MDEIHTTIQPTVCILVCTGYVYCTLYTIHFSLVKYCTIRTYRIFTEFCSTPKNYSNKYDNAIWFILKWAPISHLSCVHDALFNHEDLGSVEMLVLDHVQGVGDGKQFAAHVCPERQLCFCQFELDWTMIQVKDYWLKPLHVHLFLLYFNVRWMIDAT